MAKRKEQIHRRDRPTIERLASEGLSRRAIAARMNMLIADFNKALKADPQSQLRLESGEASHETRLYQQLLAVADRYEGKTGSVTPLLFALKARAGYNDRPTPQKTDSTVNVLVLPAATSPEQYRKQLQAARETVVAEVEDESN